MSHGVDAENSAIVRFGMLFTGVMTLLAGVVAATQLHWAALIFFLFGGLVLWGWWLACGPTAKRKRNKAAGPPWPDGVPRLYPDLDGVALCEFMSQEQFEAIKRFPIVTVLPFISHSSSEANAAFGQGLQRLLIRDLMLVPNLSVHGPEDTPRIDVETARSRAEQDARSIYVTGVAGYDAAGFRLELEIHRPGQSWVKAAVAEQQFEAFLFQCAAKIAELTGGQFDQHITEKWRFARPSSADALIRFGWILLTLDEDPLEHAEALRQLSERDPAFGLPSAEMDTEIPGGVLPHLLEGLRRDPYNAQLCFSLFCTVWQSRGWEPAALQFARRGIELSPGHGKSHMVAPHAAHPQARMLDHSELGYHLLPGNTFAVNNYISNLEKVGTRPDELVRLAKEGVSNDPHDPGNYERLIELYCELEDYRTALVVAESLQRLFEPKIGERTLYCLQQNPRMAQWLESGQFDPAAENHKRIVRLKQLCEVR